MKGKIRFISHGDLMRVFFRACIKGCIPVSISQGYSPHLKLSFGPPLSVGMSSSCEYVDMYLQRAVPIEKLKDGLQKNLPEGVRIEDVYIVSESLPALSVAIDGAIYSVKVPPEYSTDIKDRLERFLNKRSIVIERRNKSVDIRPLVNNLELYNGYLFMDVVSGERGSARPIEILGSLWPELETDELKLWQVNRERLLGI